MGPLKIQLSILCFVYCIFENYAAPAETTLSLVVSSTTPSPSVTRVNEKEIKPTPADKSKAILPQIYQMHIKSKISNRFANTTVTSKVRNADNNAQEATFSVVLPETAFISGFVMEVGGKNYTAYVKEKEEAKKVYDQAVASGLGAAHVAVSARDSNRFTVSVNVESQTKAAFYLTYEQLLKRDDGRYEQVLNINPGQAVKDLSVQVVISESRKLVNVKAPPLRSGNEIGNENSELDPRADIKIINDKEAVIQFSPNEERQKQLARLLKTKEEDGLSGQFVVQYDVERDPQGGEVLVQDGYFVHFFAPTELKPLPKHVIFVLDTSGSMFGPKMEQLKEAMHKILKELHVKDLFNLVEFNTNVRVWNLNNANSSVWYPKNNDDFNWGEDDVREKEVSLKNYTFPNAYSVNPDIIKKAIDTVNLFEPDGGTNIKSALKVGLHLVDLAKQNKVDAVNRQTIIVFLTDGEATVGETDTKKISDYISEFNSDTRTSPIFTLSFGVGADKKFLQKLSLRNRGFSKHIYEAADAALQLQDFYRQISSPLLADVTFKYQPSVTSLTTTEFPLHFAGSEIVVTGYCGTNRLNPPTIEGTSFHGDEILKPETVERSISNIERLWAYLTVQQLLEKKEISDDAEKDNLHKKALELALKYSFVTSISSLVVVKPNATSDVNTEEAAERHTGIPLAISGAAHASSSGGLFLINDQDQDSLVDIRLQEEEYESAFISFPSTTLSDIILATRVPSTLPPTPPPTPPQNPDYVFTILPWLKKILSGNGLVILNGRYYKLGLNETIVDAIPCPNTPFNTAGHCALLQDCPKVHNLLTSADLFKQHYCILKNEFAGVCCPAA